MIKLVENVLTWALVALLYVPLVMLALFVLAAPYLIWLDLRRPRFKREIGSQNWRWD